MRTVYYEPGKVLLSPKLLGALDQLFGMPILKDGCVLSADNTAHFWSIRALAAAGVPDAQELWETLKNKNEVKILVYETVVD